MFTLETPRLILRYYHESDLPDYHATMSDKVNMYFLADLITTSLDESRESLNNAIQANAKELCRRFAIDLKENNKLIGAVGYELPQTTPAGKIADPMGWFLMPEYHGRGYMTEAVLRVLEFAFMQDDCIRVVTGCFKENAPSHRVIIKAGFRLEAEKPQAMWLAGKMRDRLEFAINKGEYMNRVKA